MNARNILAKKREFMIVLSAIALIACLLLGCGSSTEYMLVSPGWMTKVTCTTWTIQKTTMVRT